VKGVIVWLSIRRAAYRNSTPIINVSLLDSIDPNTQTYRTHTPSLTATRAHSTYIYTYIYTTYIPGPPNPTLLFLSFHKTCAAPSLRSHMNNRRTQSIYRETSKITIPRYDTIRYHEARNKNDAIRYDTLWAGYLHFILSYFPSSFTFFHRSQERNFFFGLRMFIYVSPVCFVLKFMFLFFVRPVLVGAVGYLGGLMIEWLIALFMDSLVF
jgi:hypothetical protein